MINYTITVANTGNTTLDRRDGDRPVRDAAASCAATDVVGDNDALLEVGETWGYTAAHTVTQAEIDANGGGNGCVDEHGHGRLPPRPAPDTDDATVPVDQNPALNITRTRRVPGGTADVGRRA